MFSRFVNVRSGSPGNRYSSIGTAAPAIVDRTSGYGDPLTFRSGWRYRSSLAGRARLYASRESYAATRASYMAMCNSAYARSLRVGKGPNLCFRIMARDIFVHGIVAAPVP